MQKRDFFIRLFLFLLSLSCLLSVSYAQVKWQSDLVALEKQRFEAMTQKDTLFLQKVLAEDLVYIHSNSLQESKKDFINSIKTGKIVYKSIESEEIKIRIYDKTAVLNGIVHVIGSLNDKEFDIRLKYTDIYRRKGKSWELTSWQSVKMP